MGYIKYTAGNITQKNQHYIEDIMKFISTLVLNPSVSMDQIAFQLNRFLTQTLNHRNIQKRKEPNLFGMLVLLFLVIYLAALIPFFFEWLFY